MWISCDKCEKWVHPDCEIEHGKDSAFRDAAIELKRLSIQDAEKEAQRAALIAEGKDPGPIEE